MDFFSNLGSLPIQVRLLGSEQVEIILLCFFIVLPGTSCTSLVPCNKRGSKTYLPTSQPNCWVAVFCHRRILAFAKYNSLDICYLCFSLTLWTIHADTVSSGFLSLAGPTHLITGVINYQIHHKFHSSLMTSFDQRVNIFNSTVWLMDGSIVRNIIAHVHLSISG